MSGLDPSRLILLLALLGQRQEQYDQQPCKPEDPYTELLLERLVTSRAAGALHKLHELAEREPDTPSDGGAIGRRVSPRRLLRPRVVALGRLAYRSSCSGHPVLPKPLFSLAKVVRDAQLPVDLSDHSTQSRAENLRWFSNYAVFPPTMRDLRGLAPLGEMEKRIKALVDHYGSLVSVEPIERREDVLRKDLRSSKGNARGGAYEVSRISQAFSSLGLLELLRRESSSAWLEFGRSLEFDWWIQRIDVYAVDEAGPVFVANVLNAKRDRAVWLAEKLMADLRRPEGPQALWNGAPFVEFALRLWCLVEDIVPPDFAAANSPSLGTYQKILDSWGGPVALQMALGDRCDEHLKQAHWNYNGVAADFAQPPYGLIPLEILYIQHMRSRLGLETLLPKHPLLETPAADLEKWSNLPAPDPYPLLDQLLARARKEGFLPPAGEETEITWTRQRDVPAPVAASPTKESIKKRATPRTPFQKALSCLPFEGDPPDLSDAATALDFANAATDSTVAYYVDWKAPNDVALGELATGILGADDFESEIRNDALFLTVNSGSKEHRFVVERYAARSQYELVARFVAFYAPKRVALALVPYENSDSSVYLILTKSQRTALKKSLNADYEVVARELVVAEKVSGLDRV